MGIEMTSQNEIELVEEAVEAHLTNLAEAVEGNEVATTLISTIAQQLIAPIFAALTAERGKVESLAKPAALDAAAKAIYMRHNGTDWDNETEEIRGMFQRDAQAALEAASTHG